MKNKFKDIKVGDTVLIPVIVKYGYRREREFLVSAPVTRVTKTQFVVKFEYKEFKFRKDGSGLGDIKYSCCYFPGEEIHHSFKDNEIAEDQTNSFKEFRAVVILRHKLNNRLSNLDIIDPTNFNLPELKHIEKMISELESKLDE